MASLESKVDQLDKSFRDHIELVAQSMKEQEKSVDNQTRMIERSIREIHSQKSSYADIVKGTCSEVVEKVSAEISSIPKANSAQREPQNMTGIVKVFDDFIDRDRRKNNLVVHNLPEAEGGSLEERSTRDRKLFQEVMKESFRLNVTVARSFRAGKSVNGRARLLIVTLETPGVKQEVLRMAPQLRSSDKWGNIYITPDLTPAEREAARKVREELAARRKSGETNLTIRRGRIVTIDTVVHSGPRSSDGTTGLAAPVGPHRAGSASNHGDIESRSTKGSDSGVGKEEFPVIPDPSQG